MKKIYSLLLLILSCTLHLSGQCTLEIHIDGIRNTRGEVLLQLFDQDEKVVRQAKGKISGDSTAIIIRDLVPGKYAFRFFHDENLSGTLDSGVLGIPREGVGISNNAFGPFGPKPFRDWLFDLKGNKVISLKIRYLEKK